MKPVVLWQCAATWLTCASLTLPHSALAAPNGPDHMAQPLTQPGSATQPTMDARTIVDVALHEGGLLAGGVATAGAIPIAGISVSLEQKGQELARTVTSTSGGFAFSGLRGGMYQIHSPVGSAVVRLWAPGTAPPAAKDGVLVVSSDQMVRAQQVGPVRRVLGNPWVLATLIGAAIAVPIATHDNDIPSAS